jgi:hypothetical protein
MTSRLLGARKPEASRTLVLVFPGNLGGAVAFGEAEKKLG